MSGRNYYQNQYEGNGREDENVVKFGVDKSEDRLKRAEMKEQIDALFASHYGPGAQNSQAQAQGQSSEVNWEKLGEKLRKECNIKKKYIIRLIIKTLKISIILNKWQLKEGMKPASKAAIRWEVKTLADQVVSQLLLQQPELS